MIYIFLSIFVSKRFWVLKTNINLVLFTEKLRDLGDLITGKTRSKHMLSVMKRIQSNKPSFQPGVVVGNLTGGDDLICYEMNLASP